MNKKHFILLFLPFLCSCHGASASTETVLENIEKIRNVYYSNQPFEHFTLIVDRQLSVHSERRFVAYDKNEKFYHSYHLKDNALVSENWKFVRTNSDNEVNIYSVEIKLPSSGSESAPKPQLVGKTSYTEEQWKIEDVLFKELLNDYHTICLSESEGIIKNYLLDESNKSLSLSSLNSTSYYLEYSEQNDKGLINVERNIEFKNELFISSSTIESNDVYTKVNCSYDSFDVVYPKYN